MSPLLPVDPTWTGWIAGLLLHAAWIAAAVGALAWAVLVPVRDPRFRHAAAAAALAAIAGGVLIIGAATWPRGWDAVPAPAVVRITNPAPAPGPLIPGTAAAGPAVTDGSAGRADATAWAVMAWVAGVFVLALRHGVGHLRVHRLRSGALPAHPDLLALVAARCRRLGAPLPRVLLSDRIRVPAVSGWLRPVLLLPMSVVCALPPAQLEALILHELAHLRRRDALIEAGVTLLECLLFFHPAVWWLGRELREAREQCCDREALAAGAAADGLARGLLAVAQGAIAPAPALAATGGQLTERVRRILGVPGPRCWRMRGLVASALIPAVAVVVTACATRSGPAPAIRRDATVEPVAATARFPLERRIRARADGRAIVTECRLITVDAAIWARTGLTGEGPSVLAAEAADRLLASAGDQQASPTLVTRPLQSAWATAEQQMGYIGDYRLIAGSPDPIIMTLRQGGTTEACLEPGTDGSILVVTARYRGTDLLGIANATLAVPESATGPRGPVRGFPIEEPVLRTWEGTVAGEGIRLAPGQALAVPVRMVQVVRHRASARDWAVVVSEDPAIEIPDPTATERTVLVVRPRIDPDRSAQEPRLTIAAEAGWFAGSRISLTAVDEPLPQVLARLAAQLPVPTALERHPDHAATRVTIEARDEALGEVLTRLLPQTLLDARAEATGLRFTAPADDASPPPDAGMPATGKGASTVPAQDTTASDMLPWPRAGEPAVQRIYDVTDLLPAGPRSAEGWTIHIDPAGAADAGELVRRLRALVPVGALDGDRGITVVDGRGLIRVQAAPAVHDVVAAGLTGVRSASAGPTTLRIDLLDVSQLARVPGREDGQHTASFDRTTIDRLTAAAQDLGPAAWLPGAPVEVRPGQRVVLTTAGTGWMRGVRITATATPSVDRRYLSVSLAVQTPEPGTGSPRERRITLIVPDAVPRLAPIPDSDLALRIHAGMP